MSSVLQHQHQDMSTAYDIVISLEKCLGSKPSRLVAMKELMNTNMEEVTSFRDHVLEMMSHLNEVEILGADIDGETQVDIVLQSLSESFMQFLLNYYMNKSLYSMT